eukprot:491456-Ditylum_brightwellii.AAC.1
MGRKRKNIKKTVNTAGSGGRIVLHPSLRRKVYGDPLTYSELKDIRHRLYPSLPFVILDAALFIMRLLGKSGREEEMMMRSIDDDDNEVKKKGEEKREEHIMKEEEEFNDNNTSLLHKQHQTGSG